MPRKNLRPIFAIVFLAALMILVTSPVSDAFAHGGHQPPAADFSGKKVSLFASLEPIVVAGPTDPVYVNARLFDANTNENFQHVTYRIFFEKDGEQIPILTEGGQFGGQGFFYDPEGDLQIKIVPKNTASATAMGEVEPQFNGIWSRGDP